ncbi:hypothetical protein OROHE_025011 [Orobanche hederae]
MSEQELSKVNDDCGGGSIGAGDEEGEGPTKTRDPKEKKCKGCGKKGRRLSFFRLRRRKQMGINVNSDCWGRRVGGGGGDGWGCSCLKQPRSLDSSGESPTSDPNSSRFTFDMLRALIEKNDFYSKECNPHLGEDSLVKENT